MSFTLLLHQMVDVVFQNLSIILLNSILRHNTPEVSCSSLLKTQIVFSYCLGTQMTVQSLENIEHQKLSAGKLRAAPELYHLQVMLIATQDSRIDSQLTLMVGALNSYLCALFISQIKKIRITKIRCQKIDWICAPMVRLLKL